MKNPKTTISGYLLLFTAVLTVAAHALGGTLVIGDLYQVVTAVGGAGLVMASDGGH